MNIIKNKRIARGAKALVVQIMFMVGILEKAI